MSMFRKDKVSGVHSNSRTACFLLHGTSALTDSNHNQSNPNSAEQLPCGFMQKTADTILSLPTPRVRSMNFPSCMWKAEPWDWEKAMTINSCLPKAAHRMTL